MFKHISLASSSKGNCHLLSQDNGETYVMLDAGINIKTLKSKLKELDISIFDIKAVFITHEHGDHIRCAKDLLLYTPVYSMKETLDTLKKTDVNIKHMEIGKPVKTDAKINAIAFPVKHDAVNPVNFIFKNSIGEYGVYITDTGEIKLELPNIRPTLVLIEANFDEDILKAQIKESEKIIIRDRGFQNVFKNRQLDESYGHLSWQRTLKVLQTMKLGMCEQITLTHISPTNGHNYFAKRVFEGLGGKVQVKQLKATEIEITNTGVFEDYGY